MLKPRNLLNIHCVLKLLNICEASVAALQAASA